jgi:hypothetical protein
MSTVPKKRNVIRNQKIHQKIGVGARQFAKRVNWCQKKMQGMKTRILELLDKCGPDCPEDDATEMSLRIFM